MIDFYLLEPILFCYLGALLSGAVLIKQAKRKWIKTAVFYSLIGVSLLVVVVFYVAREFTTAR